MQRKINSAHFLTKVNTYISGGKRGRFIRNHKLLLETNPSDYE